MLICTVKAASLKFLAVLLLAGGVLIGLSVYGSAVSPAGAGIREDVSYENVRSESDRRAFLGAFGFSVTSDAQSTAEFKLPKSLDAVLLGYNEIQKEQGLDLSRYAGKTVTRYTYEITDCKDYDGKVYANLILYRNRIVGADLTGVGENGFVKPLTAREE